MPYVFHPFTVAQSMKDEDSILVALLHDVVEDTDVTLEDLKQMGYNDKILAALNVLTHLPGVERPAKNGASFNSIYSNILA